MISTRNNKIVQQKDLSEKELSCQFNGFIGFVPKKRKINCLVDLKLGEKSYSEQVQDHLYQYFDGLNLLRKRGIGL
jgi:hypothetical protein